LIEEHAKLTLRDPLRHFEPSDAVRGSRRVRHPLERTCPLQARPVSRAVHDFRQRAQRQRERVEDREPEANQ
jgi:hypothetical protein